MQEVGREHGGNLLPVETKCQVALKDDRTGLVQKDRGALWVEGAA